MKLKFLGAAREVTGSKSLITHKNEQYLIDCGMFQGDKELRNLNWQPFPHAHNIRAVILTHAHIDHSGYLPRLVKEGFSGPVYCTEATAALVKVLLRDAAHLEEEDAKYINRKKYSSHVPALPLFDVEDAERAIKLLKPLGRDEWHPLGKELSFRFLRAGHILGSSFVQINFPSEIGPKVITFSGDLGSERSSIIKGPDFVNETDYLVFESTYGDKVHKGANLKKELASVINKVHQDQGVILIPSFAVGRTQELIYILNELIEENLIPKIPIYIDSPMAATATEIYTHFTDDLKLTGEGSKFKTSMEGHTFKATTSVEESIRLNQMSGPAIIISAAGMLTGGRIMHHLKSRLPHRQNAVLFVGFQAEGTKGRLLQNGMDKIWIHREEIPVNAQIYSVTGMSAHADSNETLHWVKQINRFPVKTFLNHGEGPALKALAYRLKNEIGLEVVIPQVGQEFELE